MGCGDGDMSADFCDIPWCYVTDECAAMLDTNAFPANVPGINYNYSYANCGILSSVNPVDDATEDTAVGAED